MIRIKINRKTTESYFSLGREEEYSHSVIERNDAALAYLHLNAAQKAVGKRRISLFVGKPRKIRKSGQTYRKMTDCATRGRERIREMAKVSLREAYFSIGRNPRVFPRELRKFVPAFVRICLVYIDVESISNQLLIEKVLINLRAKQWVLVTVAKMNIALDWQLARNSRTFPGLYVSEIICDVWKDKVYIGVIHHGTWPGDGERGPSEDTICLRVDEPKREQIKCWFYDI